MLFRKSILKIGMISALVIATTLPTVVSANATEVITTENDNVISSETSDVQPVEKSEWDDVIVVNVEESSSLFVRERGGEQYEVITRFHRGDKFERIRGNDNWTVVRLEDGSDGYISTKYVVTGEEAKALFEKVEAEKAEKARLEEQRKSVVCDLVYSAKSFKNKGAVSYGGYRYTWYSQRVLPGGGLKIPGRHVDESGYVCDGDGYICIASGNLSKGTVVNTPLGKKGKVYDRCGVSGTLDVYVAW